MPRPAAHRRTRSDARGTHPQLKLVTPAEESAPPRIGLGTFRATPMARRFVDDVLETGRLSYGPYSRRLEREFAAAHDCRVGVLSNSGTSALLLALQALKELRGWRDGDEVLVPAVTFVATINVLLHLRLRPVLVDVEPDFYGIDPQLAERAVTNRTVGIVPVHLFGQPCDMGQISELARAARLAVVEDSCETMFARHLGRMAGSWGDVGCFSTYVAHLLVTGVGGLCTTSDPEIAVRIRSLANHGRDSIYLSIDDDRDEEGRVREEIVERRFRFEHVGHSFRITELEAALGCAALATWPEMIETRRRNATRLTANLNRHADRIQLAALRPNTEHSFMMYPLVLRDEPKDELVQRLERAGIETRDMMPIVSQPVYRRLLPQLETERFPVAEWIDRSGFYVGCHQDLEAADLDAISDEVSAYLST